MEFNPEEIRQRARTARKNFLGTSEDKEYLEEQNELAKEEYGKLLELCPNDMEAKIYCAYYEANESVDIQSQHASAVEKMMEALDVFTEDLKTSSLSLEEKEALIKDITTRVIVLAKSYNRQSVAFCLAIFTMHNTTGRGHIIDDIVEFEKAFMNSATLITHMVIRFLDCPAILESTTIRASIMVACQESLELLVEAPSFPVEDLLLINSQKLNELLDAMEAVKPNGYHYIPLPKYDWCNNDAPNFHRFIKEKFDHSQIRQKVEQHNAEVHDLEQAALQKINKEKTDKYWAEHPNRPKELNDEIDNVCLTIKQNESKIKELNQQCTAAVAECDSEPIPASAEKEKLWHQISALEAQQATLGFFQFSAKKQVKSDLAEVQAAYEQAKNDALIQERQKREKKSRVAEAYQEKIDQIEEENENLNEKLNSLHKELDNPLGLDPL